MALAAVVLPMPISPMPRRSTPVARRSSSTSVQPDRRSRASASARVIAGPSVMSAVPARTRRPSEPPPAFAAGGPPAGIGPGDADVDHGDASRPTAAGQDVDRGTSGDEVRDHLRASRRTGRPTRPGAVTPWSPAATTIAARADRRRRAGR